MTELVEQHDVNLADTSNTDTMENVSPQQECTYVPALGQEPIQRRKKN